MQPALFFRTASQRAASTPLPRVALPSRVAPLPRVTLLPRASWLALVVLVLSLGIAGHAFAGEREVGVPRASLGPEGRGEIARPAQYDPDDGEVEPDGAEPDGAEPDGEPLQPTPLPYGNQRPSDDPSVDPLDEYDSRITRSRKAEMDGDLSTVLGEKRYDYCRDLESRVRRGDSHLCRLKDAAKARCPGFSAACEKPPVGDASSGGFGPGARGERGKRGERGERGERGGEPGGSGGDAEPAPAKSDPPKTLEVPKAMSGFAQLVFWGLLLVLLAVLVFAIAKNFRRDAKEAEAAEPLADEPAQAPGEPRARGPVETDVERLLRRAHAAAAAGQFEQAMADAYAALLRHLEGNGLIDMHPSRTNGEYARHLRARPELQSALRDSAREVEAVQFGSTTPSPDGFRRVLERVMPVVSRGVALLLAAWFTVSLVACDSSTAPAPATPPSTDHSPAGVSVLQSLMIERGAVVRHQQGEVSKVESDVHTIVVHGPLDLEPEEWDALLAWVKGGGRLIVALDADLPTSTLGVSRVNGGCEHLAVAGGYSTYRGSKLTAPLPEHLSISLGNSAPVGANSYWSLLECRDAPGAEPRPHTVASSLELGSIVVLPSSDLLTNVSMASDDHAFVVFELIIGTPSVVVFVDTWTSLGEDSPFAAVSNGKLNPLLLQLFLFMALLFWWRGKHFAEPMSPPADRRRAFREHVEALGSQYAKARASRLVLGMYAAWVIERLRERCQPGRRTGLVALATAVAARTGRSEASVMRVLVDGDSARESITAPGEPVEDLKVMRELEALLADAGGSR